MKLIALSRFLFAALLTSAAAHAQSQWVHTGPDGKLVYGGFTTGDHIGDFSFAGYRGGGVALPTIATKKTVAPSGKDDTAAIQAALDEVAKLPLADGFRGAVELAAGTFLCESELHLSVSGVVLRGAGRKAAGGTTIEMTGKPHWALRIAGSLAEKKLDGATTVSDAYVPSGTRTFRVASAAGLHAGDTVEITRPVTPAWLRLMGMDNMGSRNGKPERWVEGELSVRRRIAAVSGNTVRLEVPLLDSYDAKFLGVGSVRVQPVEVSGQLSNVGVENLRVVAPARVVALGQDAEFDGLHMSDTVDGWVQDTAFEDTTNSVHINEGTERITVVATDVKQRVPVSTPAKPFQYSANGSQLLFDRITGSGDSTFFFATQARQQGPVVVLHCRFTGNGHIQPHQRWFTGLLIDNCEVPGGGIDLQNRGQMGSGHGWAIGWSVIWNSSAASLAVQNPPGSANWSIGNRGEATNPKFPEYDHVGRPQPPPGMIDSAGKPVTPASLYLAQLAERLGAQAVKNIGY